MISEYPTQPASRRRSLVGDLCKGVTQSMGFWGCDARYPDGNLLVASGFERLEKNPALTEGSSRYRKLWRNGCIELHSFCAGWYPAKGNGVVFIRHRERLFSCTAGDPPQPGKYYDRLAGGTNDDLIHLAAPFVEWMLSHENWISSRYGPSYRNACWNHVQTLPGTRPWLAPKEGVSWLESFLRHPNHTPRARDWSSQGLP